MSKKGSKFPVLLAMAAPQSAVHQGKDRAGEAFVVDASMIAADECGRRGVAKVEDLDTTSSRAVAEYLSVLDDALQRVEARADFLLRFHRRE